MLDLPRFETLAGRAVAPLLDKVDNGDIPAIAAGVITASGDVSTSFHGVAQLVPDKVPLQAEFMFDLASLTKVLFTTLEIMRLIDEGAFELDTQLGDIIPDIGQYDSQAAIRKLTIRQCLSHQTFLPAVAPIYTYGDDPERLKAYILQNDWPQNKPVYSDINFMILGFIIERLRKCSLAQMALSDGFAINPQPEMCVATEQCQWRGRVIRGQVHDENAYALGGFSGHAGLFGTLDGVLQMARRLMNADVLPQSTMDIMWSAHTPTHALGWEVYHQDWNGGEECSPHTVGHTGFTGTGLWIDVERQLAWALLTNRVHPSRFSPVSIKDERIKFSNSVISLFKSIRSGNVHV